MWKAHAETECVNAPLVLQIQWEDFSMPVRAKTKKLQ